MMILSHIVEQFPQESYKFFYPKTESVFIFAVITALLEKKNFWQTFILNK